MIFLISSSGNFSNQSALTNNNFDKRTSQIATANNNKENNILLALNSCIIDNSCDGRHSKVNFNSQPDSRRSSVTSPSGSLPKAIFILI